MFGAFGLERRDKPRGIALWGSKAKPGHLADVAPLRARAIWIGLPQAVRPLGACLRLGNVLPYGHLPLRGFIGHRANGQSASLASPLS